MSYNYGLTDIASIGSVGTVGSGPIRVFDIAIVNTSAASACITLYNGTAVSDIPLMFINQSVLYQHSDAGFRFNKTCFVVASACTASVNWIKEF